MPGVLVYQHDEWRRDYGPGRGTIEDNEITDGEFGIQIIDGSDPCVRRNVIKGNKKGGIWTRKRGRGTIVENRILENLGPGIMNEEGHPLIGQNVFDGNKGRNIEGATQDDRYTCQALKKVLWVDDNPSNNDELIDRYRPLGISFDLALDTKQALDFLARGDYALIISDIARGDDWNAGIRMIPEIRNRFPKAPPIIICAQPKAVEAHHQTVKDHGASLVTASPQEVMRWLDNILV
jgi:parallel beta-helix repeat protein